MIEDYFNIFYGNYGDSVILVRKKDFLIVYANKAAFSLYDIPFDRKDEVIGKKFTTFKLSNLSYLSPEDINKVYLEIENNGKWTVVLPSKSITNKPFLGETTISKITLDNEEYLVTVTENITDRIATKKDIIEVEKGFISVLNKLPNGIVIHTNGKIIYANPYFLKSLEITKNDLKGVDIFDIVDVNYKHIIKEQIENVYTNNIAAIEQVKFPNNNNELVSFSIQSVIDTYQGKKVIISILSSLEIQKSLAEQSIRAKIAEDANILLEKEIAKHKETQQELINIQELTNSMINSSLDIIIASNNDEKITHISPSALYVFGYTEEEMRKLKPQDLYNNLSEYKKVIDELKENGYFIGEITNISKSGNSFQSYLSSAPIKNKQGEIIGTMGVSRDIHEIKKIEQEIIDSEKRYRELFENLNDAIIILDEHTHITDINEAGKKLFGLDTESNVKIRSFIVEEYLPFVKKKWNELKRKGKISQMEVEIISQHGEKKFIEVSSNAIFENGKFRGSRDIIRDISDKKVAEAKLISSLEEKEVLLKEVHHRVKNNLQVISSILNLQSSYVKDENTLTILRESQNRIKSMSFIHESLYRTKDFSSVNFSEYIDNLARNLVQSYLLEQGKVEVNLVLGNYKLNLDQAIPCGLIINELLSNSMKYAFPNRSNGKIDIVIEKKGEKMYFTVSDDGIGLPKGLDIENTDTLGLQLVYTLISQLDGNIEVINSRGTKYLFNFTPLK